VLFQYIWIAIQIIWLHFYWGWGRRWGKTGRAVRTQATEAECNHGRTTCRLVWGAPSGSSHSEGPGWLPAGPAYGCCTDGNNHS